MQPIQGLGPVVAPQMIRGAGAPVAQAPSAATGGPSFKEILFDTLQRASATGKPAAANEQAAATLRTVAEVRNALLNAFNEIKDLRI
jgi:flagellar hook-basal body complex protein FliE